MALPSWSREGYAHLRVYVGIIARFEVWQLLAGVQTVLGLDLLMGAAVLGYSVGDQNHLDSSLDLLCRDGSTNLQ